MVGGREVHGDDYDITSMLLMLLLSRHSHWRFGN